MFTVGQGLAFAGFVLERKGYDGLGIISDDLFECDDTQVKERDKYLIMCPNKLSNYV